MIEEIIQIIGKEDGPTSIILAGVHGDERSGVEAFDQIIPNLAIAKGRVFFVYGNPEAIRENVRFTQANLNRMFKQEGSLSEIDKQSYEYDRAQFLKQYLDQSDALLDIHASFTPDSKPFVICEPNAKEIVQYLPANLIVSGFDAIEPGGTDYYMNAHGKIGICFECGYLGDPKSTQRAVESIQSFLIACGHCEGALKKQSQSFIQMQDIYMIKSDHFVLSKTFADFEEISGGQLIGTDGNVPVRAKKDGIILFARSINVLGEEAFLTGEKKDSLA